MLFAVLVLIHAAQTPSLVPTRPTLKSEAVRLGTTENKLRDALASRERSPRFNPKERRHCVRDEITELGAIRLVCRSLADWHVLGFELMDE